MKYNYSEELEKQVREEVHKLIESYTTHEYSNEWFDEIGTISVPDHNFPELENAIVQMVLKAEG